MTIELTFANVYLDAQRLERVILGGELQVEILNSQPYHFSRRRKFTTNLSAYGRIRQVQNTKSCHDFDTINLNLN